MKKFQFFAVALALIIVCVFFLVSFVIVFGGLCNLFDASRFNLGALSAFCVGFAVVGNKLAPIVREYYEDAYYTK